MLCPGALAEVTVYSELYYATFWLRLEVGTDCVVEQASRVCPKVEFAVKFHANFGNAEHPLKRWY